MLLLAMLLVTVRLCHGHTNSLVVCQGCQYTIHWTPVPHKQIDRLGIGPVMHLQSAVNRMTVRVTFCSARILAANGDDLSPLPAARHSQLQCSKGRSWSDIGSVTGAKLAHDKA